MIVILFLLSAILIAVGTIMTLNSNKGYEKTDATIVEINTIPGVGEEDDTYEVYVDYTVAGHNYTHVQLNTYDGSYRVGKTVQIMYDPSDPGKIVGTSPLWLIILCFALGAAAFVGGVAAIVNALKTAKRGKDLAKAPLIVSEGREIGEPEKLYFITDPHAHLKLHFTLEDESKHVLYEGLMTKHSPVGPHTYVFTDHVNHRETEHKVGHVNSASSGSYTVSQGFTFDGVEITTYFSANKIRVEHGVSKKVAVSIDIYHEDKLVGSADSSSQYAHDDDSEAHPIASKFRLNQYYYQIEGQKSYADVIFLALFKEALSPRFESMV